ncbi:NifU family protein [Thiobaca trueperi]|uniref:Fe-S cluster biogenesis protein NfuA n=1 Tax=Thiobaca trueperi TaxID=127458 RepID=A0A4R3N4Z5_9GAMM|nr:NifU family protein [Thiobaca trueperi]TCT24250.1 Fe-S cluster biogenesis protein NfuA [Thiobaca trueperi]
MPDTDTSDSAASVSARTGEFDPEQRSLIEAIIASVRPMIQGDGGDIELVAIAGDIIRVRLTGACLHCALAGQTLGGIRRQMVEQLGVPVRVLPASD